jgi:hypothetical protein
MKILGYLQAKVFESNAQL